MKEATKKTSLEEERDALHNIKALADSPGGKDLANLLVRDIMSILYKLAQSDADPLCHKLQANLSLLRLIKNAEENLKAVDEIIEETLSE